MKSIIRYYGGSILFTVAALICAAYVGFLNDNIVGALVITAILGVLEVSLSFDNAIVNAKVLKGMDPLWQHRFLTWGIAVAVFGVRIIFPLLIVMAVAQIGFIDALFLAIKDPKKYEQILENSAYEITAFGGAFLLMVGLRYFFDGGKEVHWIKWVEKPLSKYGKLYLVEPVLVIVLLIVSAFFLPMESFEAEQANHKRVIFLVAGLIGLVVYALVQWVETLLEGEEPENPSGSLTVAAARTGLAGFIYLEVLDASFSLDGVIGAFALSNNIFIIALGLGIGAMFVRSMTVMLVEKGTIGQYKYLEPGAFWAIIALGVMMFVNLYLELPEVVTGLLGGILIILSFVSSLVANKAKAV